MKQIIKKVAFSLVAVLGVLTIISIINNQPKEEGVTLLPLVEGISFPIVANQCKRSPLVPAQKVIGLNINIVDPPVDSFKETKKLSIAWGRTDANWDALEPTQGQYSWDSLDQEVIGAHANGINLALVINHAPSWPTKQDAAFFLSSFDTFMQALVARYKPGGILAQQQGWGNYGVSYWEVFNEPNLTGLGWSVWKDDPKMLFPLYVEVAKVANKAIRAQDVNAFILSAGLAADGIFDWSMSSKEYLAGLYKGGVGICFDIIAYHPYSSLGKFKELYTELHAITGSFGDARIPLWFNEFGNGDGDDEIQRQQTEQVLKERYIPDGFFYFALADLPGNADKFGLITADGKKKPAYDAFVKGLQK